MSMASLAVNTVLLVALPAVIVLRGGSRSRRDMIAGGIGAAAVLCILLLFRYAAAGGYIMWYRQIPGTPAHGRATLAAMAAVALLEELAKYIAVAPWRGQRTMRRGALRGMGFAWVEHLLFVLVPATVFLRRIVLASSLHMGTALLYTRPRFFAAAAGPTRRPGHGPPAGPKHHTERGPAPGSRGRIPVPLLDTLLIALGTAIHLTYNLILQGLDGLSLFW